MRGITSLFYQRLEEIEQYIRLLDDLRQLGAAGSPVSITRTVLGRRAIHVRTQLRGHRRWETISLDGCMLSIAGEFEYAARDLAEWIVTTMCSKVANYSDLPAGVRQENVRLVGELLRQSGRPRVAHIDYVTVVTELAQSSTIGTPVAVFGAGFGMHDQNLRSDILSSIYSRSEVKDLWPRLGANKWLQAYFGSPTKAGELAAKKLNQFMEDRNQIAHRGASYQGLGPTVVLDYVEFFRVLTGALAVVLEDHVAQFP